MDKYAHIKLVINTSGRKDFGFVVMTASGRALGYFKNGHDAARYCASDAQAHI